MIVGGYSLDLYCDGEPCRKDKAVQNQYFGETYAKCASEARAKGWKLDRRTGKAFCTPECTAERNHP